MKTDVQKRKRNVWIILSIGMLIAIADISYRTIDWDKSHANLVPVNETMSWVKVTPEGLKTIKLNLMKKDLEKFKANVYYLNEIKKEKLASIEFFKMDNIIGEAYTKTAGYRDTMREVKHWEESIAQSEARVSEIQREIDDFLRTNLLKEEFLNENS